MSVTGVEIQEFETLEILATAIAIFEYNGGYFKTSEFISLGENLQAKKFANKEILRSQFMVDYYNNSTQKPPLIKVTNDHREKAKEIQEYTKKEIFNLLNNKTGYSTDLYTILNKEYVGANSFGFVASAPFYFQNGKNKDLYKEKLNSIQSTHVGSLGGKVFLDNFEIIRNSKSNNFNGYVVQGICEGNLFLFFSGHDWSEYKVGDWVDIRGTIKDHVLEQNTIPMTKLNRVQERTQNGIRADSNSNMFGQRKVADSGLDFLFSDTATSSQP